MTEHFEKSIFLQALDEESEAARKAFLDRACAGNASLRASVDQLLKAHALPENSLDAPVAEWRPTDGNLLEDTLIAGAATMESAGTMIDSYRLMEQIGEGGFGLVFVAEQTHPVRRRVALKVLKPGMDSREVVARFEAERQALALMDHPNIAAVFDGGTTSTGRPYFVMELVRGVAITEFCELHNLDVQARLDLFISVCKAVQHAHQKGVIHRDIKPSNVLVTLHDGTAVVKVIDFGVAKAIGQRLTEKTIYTHFNAMIGTPLYMSPEQAEMSGLDIDTRSDIYSLGVLLYELLTGTTPFDRDRLNQAGYDEMRRIIREEPPRPSVRLTTLGQLQSTVATKRSVAPEHDSCMMNSKPQMRKDTMKKILMTTLVMAGCAAAVGTAFSQPPGEPGQREGQREGQRGPGGPGGFMRGLPVMAALDADGDGVISESEIANATAALKGLDNNKDGQLTEEEIRPAFGGGRSGPGGPEGERGPGGPGGPEGGPAVNAAEIVARWMTLDQNKDGKLSKNELSERMQGLLTRADADKDGVATKEELTTLAEQQATSAGRGGAGPGGPDGGRGEPGGFGPPNPEQFVARALEFDADKDGKLNKEELAAMAAQMGRGGRGQGGGPEGRPRQRPDAE